MAEPPPLVPSAEERAAQLFICVMDRDTRKNAAMLIREAYRDGWNAAQARIAELEAEKVELLKKLAEYMNAAHDRAVSQERERCAEIADLKAQGIASGDGYFAAVLIARLIRSGEQP